MAIISVAVWRLYSNSNQIILYWWKYAEILCQVLPWTMALQNGQCHLFASIWSFQNKFMFWTHCSVNRPQGATTAGANLGYVPQLLSIQSEFSSEIFFLFFFVLFIYLLLLSVFLICSLDNEIPKGILLSEYWVDLKDVKVPWQKMIPLVSPVPTLKLTLLLLFEWTEPYSQAFRCSTEIILTRLYYARPIIM